MLSLVTFFHCPLYYCVSFLSRYFILLWLICQMKFIKKFKNIIRSIRKFLVQRANVLHSFFPLVSHGTPVFTYCYFSRLLPIKWASYFFHYTEGESFMGFMLHSVRLSVMCPWHTIVIILCFFDILMFFIMRFSY